IDNRGSADWQGQAYHQLARVKPPKNKDENFLERYADPSNYGFTGAAWYGPDKKFNKVKFEDFKDHPIGDGNKRGRAVKNSWIAMEQPYFVGAWLPTGDQAHTLSVAAIGSGKSTRYLIRGVGPVIRVAPGQQATTRARLFLGPKVPDILSSVEPS